MKKSAIHLQVECLEARRLLTTLAISSNFGTKGTSSEPSGTVLQVLPDETILTVGSRIVAEDGDEDDETIASRLNPNGTLDTSFGKGGELELSAAGPVTYADSRIYVDNPSGSGGDDIIAYTPDGVIDTTFGDNGSVNINAFTRPFDGLSDSSPTVNTMIPAPGGGVLIKTQPTLQKSNGDFVRVSEVAKMNYDGTLDTTFADHGIIVEQGTFGGFDVASLVANAQGILLPLDVDGGTLFRYNIDGTPATAFGTVASVKYGFNLGGLIEQPDGKAVLSPDPFIEKNDRLIRLNPDGSTDTTFGDNGEVSLKNISHSTQFDDTLFEDGLGRIYIGAKGLYRFSPDGVAEGAPFDGSLTMADGRQLTATAVAVDSDGRLLFGSGGVTRFNVTDEIDIGPNQTLFVTGSNADDGVTIDGPSNQITAVLNDQTMHLIQDRVLGVDVRLQAGTNALSALIALPTTVYSGSGNDEITTGSSNNHIYAGDGDNTVHGGDGNDFIQTGSGRDSLYGGAGIDTLRGGSGSDLLNGAGGRDHLLGQGGNDRIYAGNGNDAIDAGPGDDRIFGQAGDDMIIAGSGNDQIDGGAGSDYLAAGPGDDTLTANDSERDSVYGGDGNDTALTDPLLDVLRSIEH